MKRVSKYCWDRQSTAMTRRFFSLLLPVFLAACSENNEKTTSTGKVIQVAEDDAEMNAAMESARKAFGSTWEEILNHRQEGSPEFDAVMVKGYFADTSDPLGGEHLWIQDTAFDGLTISGVVASEPLDRVEPNLGDRVSLPLERLTDWLVVDHGLAKGAFTVQLLRRRMSPSERAEHDSHYPFRFSEP